MRKTAGPHDWPRFSLTASSKEAMGTFDSAADGCTALRTSPGMHLAADRSETSFPGLCVAQLWIPRVPAERRGRSEECFGTAWRKPCTIPLLTETTDCTQPAALGMDAGSRQTGSFAATSLKRRPWGSGTGRCMGNGKRCTRTRPPRAGTSPRIRIGVDPESLT